MLFVLLFGGVASADDQSADTTNAGVGGANTGVNAAAGNGSGNTATSDQEATATGGGDDAVSSGNGSTGNTSNGSASVQTGDANATGNSATNNTQQTVVQGHNGAVVIVDQDASITNIGIGISNTGGNLAIGNGSTNTATADQTATADGDNGDAVAANTATVRNNSGGDARVETGDASAIGSTSTNTLNQTFDGDFSGGLGVVVLVDQNATVNNIGIGIANTGLNAAVGNASINNASVTQDGEATNAGAGDAVSANNATATTNSNGSAGIITGDASAVGNAATNNVSQVVNVNAQGSLGSIVLVDQNAAVNNIGISFANTGLNLAVGNLSQSTSNAVQGAVSGAGPPATGDSVASNDGTASTDSNGSASIKTGHAEAAGNRSTTNLTQVVDVNAEANGIVLTDQAADVLNLGIAVANTGGNAALGNLVFINNATVTQGPLPGNGAIVNTTGDDAVAANFGSATTTSNGDASVNTGSAGAGGNSSTTNVAQTVNADTNGGIALPDQSATVVNFGIGIANTGLNAAVGNISQNNAETVQDAATAGSEDDAVASNFGDANTHSDGHANVTTGNANSFGNDSAATTNIAQTVDTDGVDNVLADQSAVAVDFGIGFSNTGLNAAVGNASVNNATTTQSAIVDDDIGDDAVASNFGEAIDHSNGSASITTGNANSVGSSAHTNIAQTVNDNGDGFLLTDQSATSVNIGVGIANTGLNAAIGNASTNNSTVGQTADLPDAGTGDAVAANFGTSSNQSDGSASIHTGNAAGVGTRSTTSIAQTVDYDGSGFTLPDQTAVAVNVGVGLANTGGNIAVGNISGTLGGGNNATLDQEATVEAGPNASLEGDIVASNDGTTSNESNGSAEIWTGSADAIGNDAASTLNITQTADADGAGFALVDQTAVGVNVGIGIANTGLNAAIGNASLNNASTTQDALVEEDGGNGFIDADDVVASNNSNATNNSNGSAKIVTGPANSVGNKSTTNITQTSDFDGDGFALVDQSITDVNIGFGLSNTGLNLAVGNISQNGTVVDQDADVSESGAGGLTADDVVAANTATNNNTSNGKADITTGAAKSVGNASTANLNQVSNSNLDGGFVLNDQTAVELNLGAGIANTGVNAAIGNVSTNTTESEQDAIVEEDNGNGNIDAEDVVAANTNNTINHSNGDASVTTGWADATGNKSTTTLNQVADTDVTGNGFVINDQSATVVNLGAGIANTGINAAIGNGSINSTVDGQTASVEENGGGDLLADDVVAANTLTNSTSSDGSGSISTGAAHAIGNDSGSTTIVNQVSDSDISGSGFVLADQEAAVVNAGVGFANTGVNAAIGNISQNNVGTPNTPVTQDASVVENGGGNVDASDVVSANTLTSSQNSDGSASVKTGDAEGIGNKSTTTVNQVADNTIGGTGFVLTDQAALVLNAGAGIGNSGINAAVGNGSINSVDGTQTAAIEENGGGNLTINGDAVVANTATLANNSNGSADITTGGAGGYGNISTTDVNETADNDVADGSFVDNDQSLQVFNLGLGIGNSGINLAVGNVSQNTDPFIQDASITGTGAVTASDDVVASNVVSAANNSDGSAKIKTGNATGYGNTSTTTVSGDDALVLNLGLGLSNSGINAGIGNVSTNTIDSDVTATIDGAPLVLGDDAVASNVITESNNSDGDVDITTGDAYALGNRSATGIVNSSSAVTINLGVGLANTGLNLAAGNLSTNTTTHTAVATAPGGIASNVADLSNTSDGSARIRTGNANAFGNIASNATCQGVPFGPSCPQPPLPPLPPGFTCLPGSSNCPTTPPGGGTPPTGNPPVVNPRPVGPVLARTGLNAVAELFLGFLLLAIGALLRRRARTA